MPHLLGLLITLLGRRIHVHSRLLRSASVAVLTYALPAAVVVHTAAYGRAPLKPKPYAELPLGAITPQGWLRSELVRMGDGMTGHLDEWYPEVCGDRNAWLGGDGDCWERGPYWIDGLYPLACLLRDEQLTKKANVWVEAMLQSQQPNGQFGPTVLSGPRDHAAPPGAQVYRPEDWWPRMVALKVLQQHYSATGDQRVINCLRRYFQYQLSQLPLRPLHERDNPRSGSWWAAQRGGENLLIVQWLYDITGDAFLLRLADIIYEQTVPVAEWLGPTPSNRLYRRQDQGPSLHCVNLAQMIKTPALRWRQTGDADLLNAVGQAFSGIRDFHGQPNGLYGGDEGLHGDSPDRGSELCTAVEMMFSLEKLFEVTGDPSYGDRLDRIAFNALPTQTSRDYRTRQYFQQTNQVSIGVGDRGFFDDGGRRNTFGLLDGYPCCTCNLHQGWPKFAQHLWMASDDGGLAALSYVPCEVAWSAADEQKVTLRVESSYPFSGEILIHVGADAGVRFPLHLRIPGWAEGATVRVNAEEPAEAKHGTMHVLEREWSEGDIVTLDLPRRLKTSKWYGRSLALESGPLLFAMPVPAKRTEVRGKIPPGAPESAMHRGWVSYEATGPWNFALTADVANAPQEHVRVEEAVGSYADPWRPETAPTRLVVPAVRLPGWGMMHNSAAPPPLSPVDLPAEATTEEITLIPYGSTILRITAFPWVR